MMHKLNVLIESRLKIIELHKELLQYLQKTQPEDKIRLTSSFCHDDNCHSILFFLFKRVYIFSVLYRKKK
jgi:hypothetical protein